METKFNPVEARHFAGWLDEEIGQIRTDTIALSRESIELFANWQDDKYMSLMQILDEVLPNVTTFCNQANGYSEYLRKKAEIIEEYLNNRY